MSVRVAVLALLLSACFLPAVDAPRHDTWRPPLTGPPFWHHAGPYWSPCNLAATDSPRAYHWFPFKTCLECVSARELGRVPLDDRGRSMEAVCYYALQNDFTEKNTRSLDKDLRDVILRNR